MRVRWTIYKNIFFTSNTQVILFLHILLLWRHFFLWCLLNLQIIENSCVLIAVDDNEIYDSIQITSKTNRQNVISTTFPIDSNKPLKSYTVHVMIYFSAFVLIILILLFLRWKIKFIKNFNEILKLSHSLAPIQYLNRKVEKKKIETSGCKEIIII